MSTKQQLHSKAVESPRRRAKAATVVEPVVVPEPVVEPVVEPTPTPPAPETSPTSPTPTPAAPVVEAPAKSEETVVSDTEPQIDSVAKVLAELAAKVTELSKRVTKEEKDALKKKNRKKRSGDPMNVLKIVSTDLMKTFLATHASIPAGDLVTQNIVQRAIRDYAQKHGLVCEENKGFFRGDDTLKALFNFDAQHPIKKDGSGPLYYRYIGDVNKLMSHHLEKVPVEPTAAA